MRHPDPNQRAAVLGAVKARPGNDGACGQGRATADLDSPCARRPPTPVMPRAASCETRCMSTARAQCPPYLPAIAQQVETASERHARVVHAEIIGAAQAEVAVARREGVIAVMPGVRRAGDLSVDLVRRIVKIGDKDVRLSPKEYELLRVLVQHAGKASRGTRRNRRHHRAAPDKRAADRKSGRSRPTYGGATAANTSARPTVRAQAVPLNTGWQELGAKRLQPATWTALYSVDRRLRCRQDP
jgi:hypothetical protein